METITVTTEGMLLDALLVRRFGYRGQSLLTQTLELNPGLVTSGAVVALGTVVTLPREPDRQPFTQTPRISLFG